jgi:hypothetical protein
MMLVLARTRRWAMTRSWMWWAGAVAASTRCVVARLGSCASCPTGRTSSGLHTCFLVVAPQFLHPSVQILRIWLKSIRSQAFRGTLSTCINFSTLCSAVDLTQYSHKIQLCSNICVFHNYTLCKLHKQITDCTGTDIKTQQLCPWNISPHHNISHLCYAISHNQAQSNKYCNCTFIFVLISWHTPCIYVTQ